MSRLQALIGAVAYGVDRAVATLLWFVPFRIPGALLLAALLGFLAWQQAAAANHTLATYPTARPTTIAAILDGDLAGWLRIDGLISGPYLDSRAYTPADQGGVVRYYYVVRDPTQAQALVVRSPRQAAEVSSARTLLARIEKRPQAVTSAVAALTAPGISVDPERYLLELPRDQAPAAASPTPRAVDPSDLRGEQGEVALFSGAFGRSRKVSCEAGEVACRDGTAYEYLASDGARGVIVRSPYPPDALPVTLTGVLTPDAFRMQTALQNADLARALAGSRTLDGELFSDGVTPPLPEVTFAPATVLSGIAAFLVISKLVGYPIFRRRRVPAAAGSPLAPGEELRLEVSGRVRGAHGTVTVDREPGTLGRLTAAQIARREWQFGGRPLGETSAGADSPDPTSTQPVLTSGGGSLLLPLDSLGSGLQLTAGQLVTVGASYPSLRLRARGIDAVLGFEDQATRARALAEIDPIGPRTASPTAGPADPSAPGHVATGGPIADRRPWQLSLAALFFLVSGVGLVAAGLLGLLPSEEPRHPVAVLLPALVQSAIGGGLAFVASGLWRRQEWAREMGVNLGAAGIVASSILALGETTCLRPLGPTLAACQPGDLVGGLLALAALTGFVFSVWAIVKLRPFFR